MDDADVLRDIQKKLTALESKATTAKESKDSGGMWGWIVALVVGAVVSTGAALLLWKLNKKNEELAKLRTQIEQDNVRSAQIQHDILVGDYEGNLEALAATAAIIHGRSLRNQKRLARETERHAEAMTRVDAAKNWDQLDALNSEDR